MILEDNSVKSKYSCNVCKKQYTRKSSLDKHKILCDYKTKSKIEVEVAIEEANDKPTYDELVKIVQELSKKYVKMEEKVNEMQQYIDRKKKKMDVISWLSTHVTVTVGFLEWINMFVTVEPAHFLRLLKPETNIFECLQEVFEFNLSKPDFVCPLKCFVQKNNIFYIWDNNETGSAWKEMMLPDFVILLKIIQKKLIGELTTWKKENQKLFNDSDRVSDQFNKAVIKLMSISFSQDANMSRIKNSLYNYLKQDLDCLV